MTEFERNARYSYNEKLAYLRQSHDSQHLQTMSYGRYNVIMLSRLTKGLTYFFYEDGKLVRMCRRNWEEDIRLYVKRYIDNELSSIKEE